MPIRPRSIRYLLVAATLLTASSASSFRADVSGDAAPDAAPGDAHRQVVVARVGPRAVSAGELEDRLARVPRYQLRTFGTTAPEVRRGFFDRVVLREVLLSLGAEDRHLDREVEVEQALDRMLSSATLRALLASVGSSSSVSPEEVQRYYDTYLSLIHI